MRLSTPLVSITLQFSDSDPASGSAEYTELIQCCFTERPYGLFGTAGAQDGHLDFHTAPELCT